MMRSKTIGFLILAVTTSLSAGEVGGINLTEAIKSEPRLTKPATEGNVVISDNKRVTLDTELLKEGTATYKFYTAKAQDFKKHLDDANDAYLTEIIKEGFLNQERSGDFELYLKGKISQYLEKTDPIKNKQNHLILKLLKGMNTAQKQYLLKNPTEIELFIPALREALS